MDQQHLGPDRLKLFLAKLWTTEFLSCRLIWFRKHIKLWDHDDAYFSYKKSQSIYINQTQHVPHLEVSVLCLVMQCKDDGLSWQQSVGNKKKSSQSEDLWYEFVLGETINAWDTLCVSLWALAHPSHRRLTNSFLRGKKILQKESLELGSCLNMQLHPQYLHRWRISHFTPFNYTMYMLRSDAQM